MHSEANHTARIMIRAHGLRAQAIAMERLAESRQQGDAAGSDRWQEIHAAICELRRAGVSREHAEHRADYRA